MSLREIMRQLAESLSAARENIIDNMPLVLAIIALLCIIHFINKLIQYRLNVFGIYPRRGFGLIGIVASPFLHGSTEHLFFNMMPFFILSNLLLAAGRKTFFCATVLIMLISGSLTWLFGRRAIHVGASSVIIGYWSYLLLDAYHQRSLLAIGLAVVCLYYFAGFLVSMVPGEEKTSWEGHLFGFIAGGITNYLTPMVLAYYSPGYVAYQ